MDYNSGAVLASLNPDQRQYPASLTKMMTSYVVGAALKQGKIHNEIWSPLAKVLGEETSQILQKCS